MVRVVIMSTSNESVIESVGSFLRKKIKDNNLRVTKVAADIGLRYESLSRILHDKESCGLETALRLSRLLDFDDELIPMFQLRQRIVEKRRQLTEAKETTQVPQP